MKQIPQYRNAKTVALSIAAPLMALCIQGHAATMASNAEITEAVIDKTFQGSMTLSAFAEYYHADGNISGEGYSGKWRVADNEMCFQYGDKPETCWGLEINGPSVTLYLDGVVDGNGMLIEGNVYNF